MWSLWVSGRKEQGGVGLTHCVAVSLVGFEIEGTGFMITSSNWTYIHMYVTIYIDTRSALNHVITRIIILEK